MSSGPSHECLYGKPYEINNTSKNKYEKLFFKIKTYFFLMYLWDYSVQHHFHIISALIN